MRHVLLSIVALLVLNACSDKPNYAFMQENFKQNRATFAMIAAVACRVGSESGKKNLQITPASSDSEALLELADTVDVTAITYREKSEHCSLSMPVYDEHSGPNRERFTYRYNIAPQNQYQQQAHAYTEAKQAVNSGEQRQVAFDMKLAQRWFFSYLYKQRKEA